ncbi:MAG: methyltransferase domain-containing protein [Phyllobacteriaceae bacterium]|nr:methyltransferase domain-containing protein [Phyllobacteriaceae bacterium]
MRAIIDQKQRAANHARAARLAVPGADFLLVRALDELAHRIAVTTRTFDRALAIGPHADRVAEMLAATGKVGSVDRAVFDGDETLDVPESVADLAVSMLDLHEMNDVPGALVQIRRALRPDGLLLACVPSSGTLAELRDCLTEAETVVAGGAAPRILPFMDVRDAGGLLQRAGFALPVADHDAVTVRYDTAFDLMRDLRAMGATNSLIARLRHFTRRAVLFEAVRLYAERHADADGRVRATFSFVWMSGWVPDPGQPQPLKPGSATRSLADALRPKR